MKQHLWSDTESPRIPKQEIIRILYLDRLFAEDTLQFPLVKVYLVIKKKKSQFLLFWK
jgi:hypothetical protein